MMFKYLLSGLFLLAMPALAGDKYDCSFGANSFTCSKITVTLPPNPTPTPPPPVEPPSQPPTHGTNMVLGESAKWYRFTPVEGVAYIMRLPETGKFNITETAGNSEMQGELAVSRNPGDINTAKTFWVRNSRGGAVYPCYNQFTTASTIQWGQQTFGYCPSPAGERWYLTIRFTKCPAGCQPVDFNHN